MLKAVLVLSRMFRLIKKNVSFCVYMFQKVVDEIECTDELFCFVISFVYFVVCKIVLARSDGDDNDDDDR